MFREISTALELALSIPDPRIAKWDGTGNTPMAGSTVYLHRFTYVTGPRDTERLLIELVELYTAQAQYGSDLRSESFLGLPPDEREDLRYYLRLHGSERYFIAIPNTCYGSHLADKPELVEYANHKYLSARYPEMFVIAEGSDDSRELWLEITEREIPEDFVNDILHVCEFTEQLDVDLYFELEHAAKWEEWSDKSEDVAGIIGRLTDTDPDNLSASLREAIDTQLYAEKLLGDEDVWTWRGIHAELCLDHVKEIATGWIAERGMLPEDAESVLERHLLIRRDTAARNSTDTLSVEIGDALTILREYSDADPEQLAELERERFHAELRAESGNYDTGFETLYSLAQDTEDLLYDHDFTVDRNADGGMWSVYDLRSVPELTRERVERYLSGEE